MIYEVLDRVVSSFVLNFLAVYALRLCIIPKRINSSMSLQLNIIPASEMTLSTFRLSKLSCKDTLSSRETEAAAAIVKHRDVLRFHWIKERDRENIETIHFTRALFGLNQSQFLLGATIEEHMR